MALWGKNKNQDIYGESDDYETINYETTPTATISETTTTSGTLQMVVLRPKSYMDGTLIADSLKNGQAVVLNLEDMAGENARRLMDYVAGVIYALGGKLERPANRTFLLTPKGINVETDNSLPRN